MILLLALPFKEAVLSLVERKKIEGLTLSDIVEAMVAYVSQLNAFFLFQNQIF